MFASQNSLFITGRNRTKNLFLYLFMIITKSVLEKLTDFLRKQVKKI